MNWPNPAPATPLTRFHAWLTDARQSGLPEPTAMALATVEPDGSPAVRMVLLKHADADGFVFYTNLESPKALALRAQPKAELCFYWNPPGRQVRIRGPVTQVTEDEADAYFATRPYMSRLGAWASEQSRPLPGPLALAQRITSFGLRWPTGAVPRPPHWSGFRMHPEHIEFWTAKAFRLHERVRYTRRADGTWDEFPLYP